MKYTLFPKGSSDRLLALLGLIAAATFLHAVLHEEYWWAVFFGSATLVTWTWAYAFPEKPLQSQATDEYSVIIDSIGEIGNRLSGLSAFLERERARVADTEATIGKLNEEKTKLEPVVSTQRETVEAILAAHSERVGRNAWKERFIGFAFGTLASLLASTAYDVLKK